MVLYNIKTWRQLFWRKKIVKNIFLKVFWPTHLFNKQKCILLTDSENNVVFENPWEPLILISLGAFLRRESSMFPKMF